MISNIPKAFGSRDWRSVRLTALVTALSLTVILRLYKPMVTTSIAFSVHGDTRENAPSNSLIHETEPGSSHLGIMDGEIGRTIGITPRGCLYPDYRTRGVANKTT